MFPRSGVTPGRRGVETPPPPLHPPRLSARIQGLVFGLSAFRACKLRSRVLKHRSDACPINGVLEGLSLASPLCALFLGDSGLFVTWELRRQSARLLFTSAGGIDYILISPLCRTKESMQRELHACAGDVPTGYAPVVSARACFPVQEP